MCIVLLSAVYNVAASPQYNLDYVQRNAVENDLKKWWKNRDMIQQNTIKMDIGVLGSRRKEKDLLDGPVTEIRQFVGIAPERRHLISL
jgi:hypothetical protein